MKRKIIGLFVSLFAFSAAQAAPIVLSGKDLLTNCEIALDIFDNNSGRIITDREYLEGFKNGLCQGTIMSANEIYARDNCPMPELPMIKNVALVKQYLKDHPKLQETSALTAVLSVYESYFPCRHGNSKRTRTRGE